MELRRVRSFLSIAETLHFGRTAEAVHLSQPALSLQIRALEEEVGVRLLERNRRKTTLTAAGRAFRDAAANGVAHLDRAIRNARLAAAGKLGVLRVGFISTAGSELVPDIIRRFRQLNPEVEFSLRNILTMEQIQLLEAGALDVGFLRLPVGEHALLEVVPVHREPFVVVVSARHELAKNKKVRLSELSGQDFVIYDRVYAPGFHDLVVGMLRQAGIVPNVRQLASEMPTLVALVAAEMGISILPASALRHKVRGVVARAIVGPAPMSEIGLAVGRDNNNPLVENFKTLALEFLLHTQGKKDTRKGN
jgi:DNA-binding transcriptional LysR family regulator